MRHCRRGICLYAVLLPMLLSPAASAAVARFEITERTPFADGQSFGATGPYERIVGRVVYSIDPDDRRNKAIVDLERAPVDGDGKVAFSGDLFLLAPKDLSKGNGALLYDVNNRGNKLALGFFDYDCTGDRNDPRSQSTAGDGFLLRQGFTVAWSGWDGELLPGAHRLRLLAPVATEADGTPITGPVRCEIVPTEAVTRIDVNWANHGSYRPTRKGLETATLTWRVRPNDQRVPIPQAQWKLHVTDLDGAPPGQLPRVELELPSGLRPGYLYELIYEARDPLVHGVCFAGLRDLVSAFRHGTGAANPLVADGKPGIRRFHGFGVSQSGRFLREFLYRGFNEDEQGQRVFDGLIPHVSGAGLGSFDHRFAQPTRHVCQHDHHDYPADRFPFTYETRTDPLSKRTDGILRRAVETDTAPFVLHTQSSAEYWGRSGSLVHTDPLGTEDAALPENVRVYAFGGTQHGPALYPPTQGAGQNLANPGDYKPLLRALLLALDRWSRDGTPAAPSVYPTIAAGSLVDWDQESTGFPNIPGIRYPEVIQQPPLLDFGRRWETERIIDLQPPKQIGHYRVLVPKCGTDGNELDCLSPPEVAVPLATFTGWNLRRRDAGAENELVSLRGSFLPLPATKAERINVGDPRRSLEERYGSARDYLRRLGLRCEELRSAGYLLSDDVERILLTQRDRAEAAFSASATPR